ncbi:MAG: DUF1640 domain-containing protein [Methylococcaceae bacterium]|jgi:hypothetical protein
MTTITFDTLKFVRTLKYAQGESELATQIDRHDVRRDITDLENRMDTRFECIDGELKLMRWMLGVFWLALFRWF